MTQPPPRLAELGVTLPLQAELQRLLDALLAKSPEQRPASATHALARVDALLARYAGSPQPSAAGPSPTRARRPWLAGVGLGALAGALALWMFGTPARGPAAASAGPPPTAAAESSLSPATRAPGQHALGFASIADARRAYAAGAIGDAAYEDALAMLNHRRDELIEHEKDALKAGAITPQQYAERIDRIDARLRGE